MNASDPAQCAAHAFYESSRPPAISISKRSFAYAPPPFTDPRREVVLGSRLPCASHVRENRLAELPPRKFGRIGLWPTVKIECRDLVVVLRLHIYLSTLTISIRESAVWVHRKKVPIRQTDSWRDIFARERSPGSATSPHCCRPQFQRPVVRPNPKTLALERKDVHSTLCMCRSEPPWAP